MPKRSNDKDYYTTGQAAKMIGLNAATVYRLCKAGKIPGAFRINKWWLIKKEAFHAYLLEKGLDKGDPQ